MSSEMEDVAGAVRSCLMTLKNGTNLVRLDADYKSMEGRNIPFRQFGFPTLESFVLSVPGIRTTRRGMDLWVEAVPTKETAHISKLVAGQNQSKTRRRRSNLRQGSRNYQGMSRNSVRAVSSAYNAPIRAWNTASYNTRNNVPSRLQGKVSPPKPLFQMPIQPPATNSSGNHRYMGTGSAQLSLSPSKRMLERSIQPRQDLDYAIPRTVTPVTVNIPKPKMLEIPQPPKIQQQQKQQQQQQPIENVTPETRQAPALRSQSVVEPMIPAIFPRPMKNVVSSPIFENLQIIRPLVPQSLIPNSTGIPWQPPPPRKSMGDRLTIQQPVPVSDFSTTNTSHVHNVKIPFPSVSVSNGVSASNGVSDSNGVGPLKTTLPAHDPRKELERIARALERGDPVYKIVPVQGKNSSSVYCKIEVGSAKFSSYPQEAQTATEASILAADRALVELRKEYSAAQRLSPTTDTDLMKKRLLEIIDQHNGVFTHKIAALYQEQFSENLPSDWMKQIRQWSQVSLENGVNDSKILCRADPTTSEKAPELTPIKEKGFLKSICHVEPRPLEFPDEHSWFAFVTLATSTTEIWVRIIGENHSKKLELMTSEMAEYYSTMSTSPGKVEPGCYYAIMEGDTWHRVRVVECDLARDEAEVFFIDLGDLDTVDISRLYDLDRKFCTLPVQATRVSLVGLEDFADCENVMPCIEEILLDGVFCVVDFNRDIDDNGPVASVIFYDTSGPEDVDVNNLIEKKILQTIKPRLEGDNQFRVTQVHVTHVDINGDVFVQLKHDGLKTLVEMINKLTETGLPAEDRQKYALKRIDSTAIYFVRCTESGDWFRARFIDVVSEGSVEVRRLKMFLIDFGRLIIVDPTNVIHLDQLSGLLAKYPAQAIKVRLDNVEPRMFSAEMIERLEELAPPSQLLLLKVVKPSSIDSPPIVELFKRIQPDNVLASINNTIVLESQFTKCVDGDGNNNVKPARRRVERTSSRATVDLEETAKNLPAPKIAGIGEYFDVHVTMAANPTNFTVQPFETIEELRIMMAKLQEVCKNSDKGSHPPLESIKEGRLYAANHTDGDWYRGCVLNVINEDMLVVYFVDYGDVANIKLDKLQPLSKQFRQLPYQAIKARLVGIKPKNIDWTPQDCVRFQKLTVERNFVSVVAEINDDRHLPRDTVLGLKLIDVSTTDDVNIGNVLVQEGRASYDE